MRDNNVPIEGVEASWVDPKSGTRINTYSNDLGMACLTIPYGISGSIHVVRDGYVSDFSIPQTYKVGDVPSFTVVDMMKGAKNTVNSSIANTKFHVHEYVSNNSIRPSFEYLAEDIYLNEVPTRMLPEGANMMVLTDAVCDKYGLNHGTLYYSYEGPLPLGASLYEIVFEPDANYKCDSWTRTDSSSSVVMEVGKDYPIMLAGGPYVYTVNLSEKTKAAQTGDDNLPIVIALIVLACACGGYIAYRKLRKK
ncbi:MAG: hypothetical protein Q4F54_01605 [Coriobacteriia bacterium]|nr:hypothetical protein [Coriobacteriia bacterium]